MTTAVRHEIRNLEDAHTEDVLRLWNAGADGRSLFVTAETPAPAGALAACCGRLEGAAVRGAFVAGRLAAAAGWGRAPASSSPMEFGNLLPGDLVISWLVLADEAAADALLGSSGALRARRVYAFPEFGGMAQLTPFGTGMLPLDRRRIVAFLEGRGFAVPRGPDWGAQERFLFRLAIPPPGEPPPIPPGFLLLQDGEGLSVTLRLTAADGSVVGEARMVPARLLGREVPGAAFLAWLGVEAACRGTGLGSALLLAQVDRARRAGATEMYLTTHAERPAWKLYRRMGFEEVGRARSYVRELAAAMQGLCRIGGTGS
ncbi:MAG TPA: GNAT family N-acetyltransferase [Planctomycetota bacterium]|nr:GNAT family N-acetyltransferase [Planctomycetota bacterium]